MRCKSSFVAVLALLQTADGIDCVIPNANALVEGDHANAAPFGVAEVSHYQQVYDATQFAILGITGGDIHTVAFRYAFYQNTAPVSYPIIIALSTTSRSVDRIRVSNPVWAGVRALG